MQMTNSGAGVYYKPGIPLDHDSQINLDIGFHFGNTIQQVNYYGINNQNLSHSLNTSVGYQRELFKQMIVGVFRPVISLQIGTAKDIKLFSCQDMLGDWILIYAGGIGLQFYNRRILNEIMLKFVQSSSSRENLAFQLVIYW